MSAPGGIAMTKTERLDANLVAFRMLEKGAEENEVITELMHEFGFYLNQARNIARAVNREYQKAQNALAPQIVAQG